MRYAFVETNRYAEDPSENYQEILIAANECDSFLLYPILFEALTSKNSWREAGRIHTSFVLQQSGLDNDEDIDSLIESPNLDDEDQEKAKEFAQGVLDVFRKPTEFNLPIEAFESSALDYFQTYLRAPLKKNRTLIELAKKILTAISKFDKRPIVIFEKGLQAHHAGQYNDAAKLYESYLKVIPNEPAALANLNLLYHNDPQRLQSLKKFIEKALTIEESSKVEEILEKVNARIYELIEAPAAKKASRVKNEIEKLTRNADYPKNIEELSLEEAVGLITLFRCCGGIEQNLTLLPFKDCDIPFSPISRQIIFKLLQRGIVRVSNETEVNEFDFNETDEMLWTFANLTWDVPAATVDLVKEIEAAAQYGAWPSHWHPEAITVLRELAMDECLAYLQHCAAERGMEAPTGEKTRMMLQNILRDFSVSQCYGFIWQGARNAADYYVRERVQKRQAANSIVGGIQRIADRARAEKWDVKSYGRPKEVPRSQLSHTIHDVFMRTGNEGFYKCIESLSLPKVDLPPVDSTQLH